MIATPFPMFLELILRAIFYKKKEGVNMSSQENVKLTSLSSKGG